MLFGGAKPRRQCRGVYASPWGVFDRAEGRGVGSSAGALFILFLDLL